MTEIHIHKIKMLLSKLGISLQVKVYTQAEQFFSGVPFCSYGILSPPNLDLESSSLNIIADQ